MYNFCEKETAEKTINNSFPAEDNYPQNRENNFVTFYNDLYIPLNSNKLKAKISDENGNSYTEIDWYDIIKIVPTFVERGRMRAWKKTYQRLPESELDIMLVLWNNTPLMNRMEIVAAGEGDEESRVLYNNGDGTWIDENGNLHEE